MIFTMCKPAAKKPFEWLSNSGELHHAALGEAAEVLKYKAGDKCAWGWRCGIFSSLFIMSSFSSSEAKRKKQHI